MLAKEQKQQSVDGPGLKPSQVVTTLTVQHQRAEFPLQTQLTDTELMNEQIASSTVHVEYLLPECGPMNFPLVSDEDGKVSFEYSDEKEMSTNE